MQALPLPFRLLVCLSAILTMSTCATVGPEQQAHRETLQREIYALQADWQALATKFYADASALIAKIRLLTTHPGWPDLAEIITAYESRVFVEGPEEALRKRDAALVRWGQKWGASANDVYQKYEALSAESLDLEYSRLALLGRWEPINKKMLEWAMGEMANTGAAGAQGPVRLAQSIDATTKASLNRYRIGPLGLYERAE
jgi:hypothetical protein